MYGVLSMAGISKPSAFLEFIEKSCITIDATMALFG